MIRLIGPGGAGKSTAGALLAARLGTRFVDLDERFGATVQDISEYINARGYDAYAAGNVQVYADLFGKDWVLALSSGFMTYREDIHPDYARFGETSRRVHRRSCFYRHWIWRRAWRRRCGVSSAVRSADPPSARSR